MSSGENLRPTRRCGGKARGFQEEPVSGNRTAARQTGCLLDRKTSTFAEAMVDRKAQSPMSKAARQQSRPTKGKAKKPPQFLGAALNLFRSGVSEERR
jgi:hypothetical protein